MFGIFQPSWRKQACLYLDEARKVVAYKRDLRTPEEIADAENEIALLADGIKRRDKESVEASLKRVDAVIGKIAPLPADAAIRENVEVFLTAIVIALGIRTFFLQPFTIPTSSMYPTLYGIQGITTETVASWPVQLFQVPLLGRSWHDLSAKQDERIVEMREMGGLAGRIFSITEMTTDRGNTYRVWSPIVTVQKDFGVFPGRAYTAGQTIMRGYTDTGDHVFVDKFTWHFRKPRRGETIVFNTQNLQTQDNRGKPPGNPSQFYIKRLTALPGDEMRIAPPELFINGHRAEGIEFDRVMSGTLDQPKDGYRGYGNGADGFLMPILRSPRDTYKVPAREYFAMGDNSYASSDSRDWGPVPERNLMGRGIIVYWPFGKHFGFFK